MNRKAILLCMSLQFCASAVVNADMLLTGQNRVVSAVNNKVPGETVSAVDFDRFNESASASWEGYTVTATQDSTMDADQIVAQGTAEGSGPFTYSYEETFTQDSSSYLEIDFEIETPQDWWLVGVLAVSADLGGTNYDIPKAWVTLSGESGEIFSVDTLDLLVASGSYEREIDEQLSLDVGQYTLVVAAETHGVYTRHYEYPGVGGGGFASYDVVFSPEPSTALLLSLGIAGLAAARRSRQHQP